MGVRLECKRRNRVEFEARRRIFPADETGNDAMSEATQHYHVFETAMGFCAIAWSDAGIARFQLPIKSAEAAERVDAPPRSRARSRARRPATVAAVVAAAKRYFDGEEMDFSQVRLDLAGRGPILRPDLRRPAPGRLGPHDHLWRAGEGGWRRPRSGARCRRGDGQESRAVDRSLSPGLAAGGKIGGFSAPGGSKTKARMLELEGVRVGPPEEAAQQIFQFLKAAAASRSPKPACQRSAALKW